VARNLSVRYSVAGRLHHRDGTLKLPKHLGRVVLIAFLVRLGWIILGHTYKFKTVDDNFGFGFEMGRIGRSLVLGEGFSNPFGVATGATAWEPPLYPLLVAAVFKLCGIYTKASAIVLLSINSAFAALTCIPIFLIARRSFNESVGHWTSWLWAVLPPIMFWSTRWVWETSLATFLLTLIFWLTLTLEDKDGLLPWIQFGVLWGVSALTNTSLLAFLPASGLWICYRRYRSNRRFLVRASLAAVMFAICVSPWIIRNHAVFGDFVFIRSNFGAELRLGNGPGADGTWMEYLHPTKNDEQLELYRDMGEIDYIALRKREAIDFIRADYGRFARLCLKRLFYYWGGIPQAEGHPIGAFLKNSTFLASSVLAFWGLASAMRTNRAPAWLFFWLIASYPLVFYITFPHPRYRHPIEPELGILIVYSISEAVGGRAKNAGYSSSKNNLHFRFRDSRDRCGRFTRSHAAYSLACRPLCQ
jgi:4-amino-4-deoxy-L-arabinose transferase-like glycosyltransferase